MIVSCPNCFLEQPLDQYCAGCGKELDKLLEAKKEHTSLKVKRTKITVAVLIVAFLGSSYLYYSSLSPNKLLSQKNDENNNQVKVALPKDKIVGDKESSKAYAVETKKKKAPKRKKKISKKPAAVIEPATEVIDSVKKIKTFYFISTENCDDPPSTGELNAKQYSSLIECASVHFKTSRTKVEDVLDDSPSFATQFSLKVDEYLIELSFSLTTDLYEEEFKQTLPLDIEFESVATLWANTGHDIESVESPDKDMLSSYATSVLFNFVGDAGPPPKLYFLASYK